MGCSSSGEGKVYNSWAGPTGNVSTRFKEFFCPLQGEECIARHICTNIWYLNSVTGITLYSYEPFGCNMNVKLYKEDLGPGPLLPH